MTFFNNIDISKFRVCEDGIDMAYLGKSHWNFIQFPPVVAGGN